MPNLRRFGIVLALVVVLALVGVLPAFAQTATIIPLEIPINPIISNANMWSNTLGPVLAIGIGLTVALTFLLFFGDVIVSGIQKVRGRK